MTELASWNDTAARAAIAKHYQGDDSDLKVLMAGVNEAFEGMGVEEYAASVAGPTASPRSSPPAATATSCARSRRRCTASRPSGAEEALAQDFTVVSVKRDWATVFADPS